MKPLLRGHFHQAMFFIFFGASLPLLARANSWPQFLTLLIYVICALTMFGVSTIYHRVTWNPEKRLLWKKLDHAGIYLMIAGTFTPIAYLVLSPESSFVLLVTIWSVAMAGIIQSIFFVNLPKMVSSVLYLIAGYLILPYIPELKEKLGQANITLILLGGLSYSVGAICYGLKRPILRPKYFSYHEVFHLFVNLGAAFHFAIIYSIPLN